MEELAPIIVMPIFFISIIWVVRLVMVNRRLNRVVEIQAELQNRLLEKFDSPQEVLNYLQSDVGERFLEAATIDRGSPYHRILGAVQSGIILALGGAACLFIRSQVPEAEPGFLVLGAIGVAVGAGFLLSGVVAFALSKSWGLINGHGKPLANRLSELE